MQVTEKEGTSLQKISGYELLNRRRVRVTTHGAYELHQKEGTSYYNGGYELLKRGDGLTNKGEGTMRAFIGHTYLCCNGPYFTHFPV